MRALQWLIAILATALVAFAESRAINPHAKALTAQQPTVTLIVHDAAGRVFNVTATRIDPPFSWNNAAGNITLTLQSDELLCSGFGVKQ
jgi:hypothetical protein